MNFENKISETEKQWQVYKDQALEELKKISPSWAYGNHISKLLSPDLRPYKKLNTIILVKTAEIIRLADFQGLDTKLLFTGEQPNDNRVAKILCRWDNNEFIDPPSLYIDEGRHRKLSFSDGRHRTKVSYILGFETIPVAFRNCDIAEIKNLLRLSKK